MAMAIAANHKGELRVESEVLPWLRLEKSVLHLSAEYASQTLHGSFW